MDRALGKHFIKIIPPKFTAEWNGVDWLKNEKALRKCLLPIKVISRIKLITVDA